jgi:glycosyltransferase involved in cell wall biosynthesis
MARSRDLASTNTEMSAIPDVTFMVCTHNRAAELRKTLAILPELQKLKDARSEVLVVDNNCSDNTADVVKAFAQENSAFDVRLVNENRLGVGFARKRGMLESRGRLIVFLDDDCRLESDWLIEMMNFERDHPRAGAFGGRNTLAWEVSPDALCLAYGESLARQDWGDQPFPLPMKGKRLPCGAGLVLRREAVFEAGYVHDGWLTGRHPKTFGAGEDTEVQILVRRAGWEIWYAPFMRLQHWIPAYRMRLPYLRRLHRGFGRAEIYLRLLGLGLPLNLSNRWLGFRWALEELRLVLARFWLGFVRYRDERPTWLIRLSFAIGCLEGACALLFLGRVR